MLLGMLVIVVTKIVNTAVVARLCTLTQPALMRLRWFALNYARWMRFKHAVLARAGIVGMAPGASNQAPMAAAVAQALTQTGKPTPVHGNTRAVRAQRRDCVANTAPEKRPLPCEMAGAC